MTAKTNQAAPAQNRDLEVDWIRGLACVFMLIIHVVLIIGVPTDHWLYKVQVEGIYQFYAWFFVASGMNVARRAQRDLGKPWQKTTASYLLVTLALFVLGAMYSVNRRTFGQMELFQGIAACTAVTYLVMRRRWPDWSVLIISVLLFGVATDYAYMFWNYPHAEVMSAVHFNKLVTGIISQFSYLERFLFVHFSLLPWVSWFLLGGVILHWAGTKREWILWAMFAAFLVLSFIMPYYLPRTSLDYYLRGKIDFLLRSSAMAGLSILAARRWYKGILPINKKIEFIGRESLLIFVLQWFTIDVVAVPLKIIAQTRGAATWKVFPFLQAAAVILTYRYTKYFAARRDRTIMNENYLRNWLGLTVGFFLIALFFYERRLALSYFFSFPVILGVGMAFPAVRLKIRGYFYKPRPKPQNQSVPTESG